MGSPLSPAMANLIMEEFEKKALATSTLKPGFWFRYVDDTLSSWAHGLENLHRFLEHINSGGSSVSQNQLPQLILGYIYILKYLQSNFIG